MSLSPFTEVRTSSARGANAGAGVPGQGEASVLFLSAASYCRLGKDQCQWRLVAGCLGPAGRTDSAMASTLWFPRGIFTTLEGSGQHLIRGRVREKEARPGGSKFASCPPWVPGVRGKGLIILSKGEIGE